MSVSLEAINQSIFVAALFLAMISVPKLLVLTEYEIEKSLFEEAAKELIRILRGNEGMNCE